MIKYLLGSDFLCWKCGNKATASAGLQDQMAQWQCDTCASTNYVIVDTIRLRIGQRLWGAAEDYFNRKDYDIAAILLVSSVDASLGVGIHELKIWRALEQLRPPPKPEDVDDWLAKNNYPKKVAEFERLAGAIMRDEISRLSQEGKIPAADLPAFERLVDDFKVLARERNRFIHLGQTPDFAIIRDGVQTARRAVWLLETMYHAAFDLKRSPLPSKSPNDHSRPRCGSASQR